MLHEEEVASERSAVGWRSTALSVGLLLALIVVGAVVFTLVSRSGAVPRSDDLYLRLVLLVGLGVVAVVVIGRIVHNVTARFAGRRHAGLVVDIYRIVAYSLLGVVALYAVGVNGYALLAGGTFAGLVVGLASQTALANVVAGIVLVLARPFEPGDRITLTSAQYSFLLPSYPPKFYSQDLLIPGYTGSVLDVGLMYTALRLDDGPTVLFPNSLVIGGAVISHNIGERWVRVKYEVPSTVDPVHALAAIRAAVVLDDWVVAKKSVRVAINAAMIASYAVCVDALCSGNQEEAPRSALYVRIMHAVAALAPPGPTGLAPASPPAAPPMQPPPGPPPSPPNSNALAGH
ncbi:MAG: mechanosensitive ion channel family protein [Thermoplasmata archaeon]|nr:mechanosensitive ion channel family protein [Thermoplasmata archaeon]